jgi:RNA polymerase sporulation-specific sigma factor
MGWGNVGLVKAARRFNPAFGSKFSTYAVPMIYGEIQRFMRDFCIINFSRPTKDLYQMIVRSSLVEEKPEHIALSLGVDVGKVHAALSYGCCRNCGSLDDVLHPADDRGKGIKVHDVISSKESDFDFNLLVSDICGVLGTRDSLIFRMFYLEECSQQVIARKVGMSQAHVSRSLTAIKMKVRKYIKESEDVQGGTSA